MSDPWMERLRAAAEGGEPLEGEVLRVKLGFNPNSSSVGSLVTVLFWSATAGTMALNYVAATLAKRKTEGS